MNVSEALIREIVTKVLEESAGKGGKPELKSTSIPAGSSASRPAPSSASLSIRTA